MFGVGNGHAEAVCRVCLGWQLYICMCICLCTCMYAYVRVYVCIYVYVYVYILYIYVYVYIHVYVYIYRERLVFCLYCQLWVLLAPCPGVYVVDFVQVNTGWVLVILMTKFLLTNDILL